MDIRYTQNNSSNDSTKLGQNNFRKLGESRIVRSSRRCDWKVSHHRDKSRRIVSLKNQSPEPEQLDVTARFYLVYEHWWCNRCSLFFGGVVSQSHREKVIEAVTNGICSCLATCATWLFFIRWLVVLGWLLNAYCKQQAPSCFRKLYMLIYHWNIV